MIKVLIPLFGTHRHTLVDGLRARKVGRFEYKVYGAKSVDLKVRGSQKSGVQESKDLKAQRFHIIRVCKI